MFLKEFTLWQYRCGTAALELKCQFGSVKWGWRCRSVEAVHFTERSWSSSAVNPVISLLVVLVLLLSGGSFLTSRLCFQQCLLLPGTLFLLDDSCRFNLITFLWMILVQVLSHLVMEVLLTAHICTYVLHVFTSAYFSRLSVAVFLVCIRLILILSFYSVLPQLLWPNHWIIIEITQFVWVCQIGLTCHNLFYIVAVIL